MKHIILLLILFGCFFRADAQTSNVLITDIHVNLDLLSGGMGTAHTRFVRPDSLDMQISFKVSDITSCSKAYIYMGTVQDSSDVRNVEAQFTHLDTSYYLNCNGVPYKVENNVAVVLNKFSKQELLRYHYITLFVEDMNANTSNRLYFNKK